MKLARALLSGGELLQARTEVESILDESPGYTGAWILYGTICHRLGDAEMARQQWEQAAEEAPNDRGPGRRAGSRYAAPPGHRPVETRRCEVSPGVADRWATFRSLSVHRRLLDEPIASTGR